MKFQCPNKDCKVSLKVPDHVAGKKIKCPKCSKPIQVPETDSTVVNGDSDPSRSPNACPACGAQVETGAVICTDCGNSLGSASVPSPKKALALMLAGGGVILLLILLLVSLLFLGNGEEEPRPEDKPREPQVAEETPEEVPEVETTTELPDEPDDEEETEKIIHPEDDVEIEHMQEITRFLGKIMDLHEKSGSFGPEELAESWGEIGAWAYENGLLEEALLSTHQAYLLDPDNMKFKDLILKMLPHDEIQGNLEEVAENQITIRNNLLEGDDLDVGFKNEGKTLGQFEELSVNTSDDTLTFTVGVHTRTGETDTGFIHGLSVLPGMIYDINLISTEALPKIEMGAVNPFIEAFKKWERYQESFLENGADSDEIAIERIQGGFKMDVNGSSAQFIIDEGNLESIVIGKSSLNAVDGKELMVSRVRRDYEIVGRLRIDFQVEDISPSRSNEEVEDEEQVEKEPIATREQEMTVFGDSENPAVLTPQFDGKWGRLSAGILQEDGHRRTLGRVEDEAGYPMDLFYELIAAENPVLSDICSLISGDYAVELTGQKLIGYFDDTLFLSWLKEAQGDLPGGNFSQLWVFDEIQPMASQVMKKFNAVGNIREIPFTSLAADPKAQAYNAMGGSHLMWQVHRVEIAETFGKTIVEYYRDNYDILAEMLPIISTHITNDDLMNILPHLSDARKSAAVRQLRYIPSPDVVALLGYISDSDATTDLRRSSFLTLGEIGTPQALEYCLTLLVEPELHGAALAAAITAGSLDDLLELEYILQDSSEKERQAFITSLCELKGPGALFALYMTINALECEEFLSKIATRTPHFNNKTASHLLGLIIDKSSDVPLDVIRELNVDHCDPLIPSLDRLLASGDKSTVEAGAALAYINSRNAENTLYTYASDNNAAAVMGLALIGSAETLQPAMDKADLITTQKLDYILDYWGGKAIEVPRKVEFLTKIVNEGGSLLVRLKAANHLRKGGAQVPNEILLKAAADIIGSAERTDQINDENALDDAEEIPNNGFPTQDDAEFDNVEMLNKMLSLLGSNERDTEMSSMMLDLLEIDGASEYKLIILRHLGRISDEDAEALLLKYAADPEEPDSQQSALDTLEFSLAALLGLAEARHEQTFEIAAGLLRTQPPELDTDEDKGIEDFTVQWRHMINDYIIDLIGIYMTREDNLLDAAAEQSHIEAIINYYSRNARSAARNLPDSEAEEEIIESLRVLDMVGRLPDRAWRTCVLLIEEELTDRAKGILLSILKTRSREREDTAHHFRSLFADFERVWGDGENENEAKEQLETYEDGSFYLIWQEMALQLAQSGRDTDYEIIIAGLPLLNWRTIYRIIDSAVEKNHESVHFSLFQLAIESLGNWKPESSELHVAGSQLISFFDNYNISTKREAERKRFNNWQAEWRFAVQCLDIIGKAPADYFNDVNSEKLDMLLRHPDIGALIAQVLSDTGEDIDVVKHWEGLFRESETVHQKLKTILAARREGNLAARDFLENVLMMSEDFSQEGVQNIPAAEMQKVFNTAARSLAYMEGESILRRAPRIAGRDDTTQALYIALGAIHGTAYFAPEQEPLNYLFDLMYTTSNTPVQKACADAILDHFAIEKLRRE